MTVDVLTMGEMLIDFVPVEKGVAIKENEGFLRMAIQKDVNKIDDINKLSILELGDITRFANAVGALTTRTKGAISALPDLAEVNKILEK